MAKCNYCCDECKQFDNCKLVADGYYFLNGAIVAEPYDTDEYGNIMDEQWYINMSNYGMANPPKEMI